MVYLIHIKHRKYVFRDEIDLLELPFNLHPSIILITLQEMLQMCSRYRSGATLRLSRSLYKAIAGAKI